MEIAFPQYLNWRVVFTNPDPLSRFGKQTYTRINKSIPILKEAGYEFIIEEVDEKYLDKFVPIYEEFISSKERGTVFPIRSRVTYGQEQGREYKALSLYKHGQYLGGIILSIDRKTKLFSTNYKVLPHSIEEKIPISVSFVAEFYLFRYALENGFSTISHGTDRNIYGYHSNIGLATFKLQVGCRPFIPATRASTGEPNQILTAIPVFNEDMLLFLGDTHEEFMTKALLVSEKSEEELQKKFPMLFSNKYFETQIVSHSEVPTNPDWK